MTTAQPYATTTQDAPYAQHFTGRYAIITGGTQGLGLATAELLMRRGLAGAMLCGRNTAAGTAAAARLSATGANVMFQTTDLSNLQDCDRLFARAQAAFDVPDILINCAGTTDRASILDADAAIWEKTFAINTRAPFFLMQKFAKALMATGRPGHVVNIASIMAHGGTPDLCVYAASKAALNVLTKNAAFVLARHQIRINALMIGWMDSDAERALRIQHYHEPEDWQIQAGRKLPAGRLLSPNEVARWIAHLCCEESGIMTGSVLDLDHGINGVYEETPLPGLLAA